MKNLIAFLLAFVVVVGAGVAAFETTQGLAQAAPSSAASLFPSAAPAERHIPITMMMVGNGKNEMHVWLHSTVTVRAGDKVTLEVRNADMDAVHGFSLPAFGIDDSTITPGEEKTFTFTADKPGIYDFKCARKGCALDHDRQTGQLIVLP